MPCGVLNFDSVNEILKCNHSNENYRTVIFPVAVCFTIVSKLIWKHFTDFRVSVLLRERDKG